MLQRTPRPQKQTNLKIDANKFALIQEAGWAKVRSDFALFRRIMRPTMAWGWWLQELAETLEQFYFDLEAGKRPKLVIATGPQHGKTWTVTDFLAWVAGRNPELKSVYASYSDQLGERANLEIQRLLMHETYQKIFPRTCVGFPGWKINTQLIEFCDFRGSFRNTTVEGQLNGMELHLGVIDDPVKGPAEAASQLMRDKTWSWFTDVFMSRFHANAGMLICMTRWHQDDLLGRFALRYPDLKIFSYPSIAEVDEIHHTRLGTHVRYEGEALFPEWKPLDFLLERKHVLTQQSWEALYQQHPIIVGGGIFPIEKLTFAPFVDRGKIKHSIRYWDKAGTEGGSGAQTAGVLMHSMRDNTLLVEHSVTGRWSALEREEKIKFWTNQDKKLSNNYEVVVEQEPGSGGKESAEATIRNLQGFRVYADKVTGSKEIRAEPYAAQVQGNNVRLVAGEWNNAFIDEHEVFPNGKYKDQVDAAAGAFAWLSRKSVYDTSYSGWVTK